MRLRSSTALILAVALVAAFALAGCGTSSSAAAATPTASSTPLPTATPTATPVPTASSAVFSACFGNSFTAKPPALQFGDIVIAAVVPGGLAYPSVQLPASASPSAPFKVQSVGPSDYTVDFPNSPVTNPGLDERGGGFAVSVCNASASQTHTLKSVSAKIVSLTPYTGQVNQWNACEGAMDSHHNLTGGGCGGATAGCICFHAAFPAGGAAGSEVGTTQTDGSLNNPGDGLGKLPLALAPGKSVNFYVGMSQPQTAGTYVFTFGLVFDAASPIYTPATPPTLLSPNPDSWGAQKCQKPAMLVQIKPTSPETYYICG